MLPLILFFKVPRVSDLHNLSISNTSQKPSTHSFLFSLHRLSSALFFSISDWFYFLNNFSPLPPFLCFPSHRVGLDIEWRSFWGLSQTPPLAFSLL